MLQGFDAAASQPSQRHLCGRETTKSAADSPKSAAWFHVCLRPVYKPHSVQRNCFRLCSHLSGRCVAAPLDAAYPELTQPTQGKGTCGDEQPPIVHRRIRSCLALLPAGVTWPRALLRAPVVSYTTVSPSLPHPRPLRGGGRGAAVCFCGPVPAGSRLSAAFPPRGLSDAVL